MLATGLALVIGAAVASRLSPSLFYAAGLLLLAMLGWAAWRWPRVLLVGLVLSPIIDRYLVAVLVADGLRAATTYFSEALLLVVGAPAIARAVLERRLQSGLWHPANGLLLAVCVLGVASALVNAVPPWIAAAGLLFTLEATTLFSLARLTPFSERQASGAAAAFVVVGGLAALLAMGQVLLHPNFLGLGTFAGRFGEGYRVASFLVSPNMLGALLAMGLPFTVLAALQLDGRPRLGAWALAGLLSLALLYTFSRGAWLAVAGAMLVVAIVVDRRVLPAMLLLGVLTFATAILLPRHLLSAERDQQPFDLIDATLGRIQAIGEGSDLRVQYIDNALPIIADHPILGAGPGRYGGAVARTYGSPLYRQYTAGTVPATQTVDNFWLHQVVEQGVLGVLAFAAAMAVPIRQALVAARRATGRRRVLLAASAATGLVAAIASLAEMLLEGNTTSFATWFFLGVATTLAVERPQEGEAPQ